MWYMHIPYSITLKRVNISRIYKEKEAIKHNPVRSHSFKPHSYRCCMTSLAPQANLKSSQTIVDDVSYLLSRHRCLRQADAKG